jgi:hypothetical protein
MLAPHASTVHAIESSQFAADVQCVEDPATQPIVALHVGIAGFVQSESTVV